MEYGLRSEDPEELAYYNKIREEMKQDRTNGNMGIERTDQKNISEERDGIYF